MLNDLESTHFTQKGFMIFSPFWERNFMREKIEEELERLEERIKCTEKNIVSMTAAGHKNLAYEVGTLNEMKRERDMLRGLL